MKRLVKFVPLVIILVTLGGCYSSCGPIHIGSPSYTLTWNPEVSGFSNVNLTLTPIIPPKALSWKPSDYVQVDLTVGNFSFSTDDPAYQCLETVATTVLPIIFAPESEVISGFNAINDFLIAYHACGQFVQTSHANLASLGGIAENNLIFFQITGQKMVSQTANGQEYTPSGPVGGPTPTPTPTPTVTSVPTLRQTSFSLPKDATPNNNGYIGPFCCTGRTVTVFTTDNQAVGYIYFYSWHGQAYNIDSTHSIAPDISFLVSGASDLANAASSQQQSSINFMAAKMTAGASRSGQAGRLSFTATIQNATLETFSGQTYYDMGSVTATMSVSLIAS